MLEKLALRLKAYWAVCEYRGGHAAPSELIRRPLKGIETLSPAQRRTRLLTSLAVVRSLHKAGHLCADDLPSSCQEIVKAAPEMERYELVNIAFPLGTLAYKHPRMPIQSLLKWHKSLIELLPPSERLVPVNTALDFAKKVSSHGEIDNQGLSRRLGDLTCLLPEGQRRELVDFGVKLDMDMEKEWGLEPKYVLKHRVSRIQSLPKDQRNNAVQRYGLWKAATAAWTEFATKGDSDALPTLRETFALCGAPPAETGITGVTISEKIGQRRMICAIFKRAQGESLAVIGSRVLSPEDTRMLADDAPLPPWMGPYAPEEREFIRQNLPKPAAPAAA